MAPARSATTSRSTAWPTSPAIALPTARRRRPSRSSRSRRRPTTQRSATPWAPSVNVVTKSGTNRLTGQVYEWFRGSALDAQDYFDQRAGRPKRDYTDNRFGAAVGGPIVRNRTFYFANVEVNPFEVPTPAVLTVPTERMRSGDFSELLALGPQYQIYDPATTRPHPTQPGRFIRDPFPGNIIPANRISPIARRILDYFPLPNQAGNGGWRQQLRQPDVGGRRDVLHGHDARRSQPVDAASGLRPLQLGLLGGVEEQPVRQRRLRHRPQPQEPRARPRRCVHVAGQRADQRPRRLHAPAVPGAAPEPGVRSRRARASHRRSAASSIRALATFPNVAIGGYTPLGTWESGDGFFTTDVYNATGSLMWLLGNHNLKFGTEYRQYVEHASRYPTAVSPTLTFNNQWTRGPIDNAAGRAARPGTRVVHARLPGRRIDEPRRRLHRAQRRARRSTSHNDWRVRSNLTREPRAALRVRDAADRSRATA